MVALEQHLLETRRQTWQREIDATKSAAERNRLGQFATPYPLALQIAAYVRSLLPPAHPPLRFADPSIGSGSFYSAATHIFGRESFDLATGIELDPAFADAADALWGHSGLRLVRGDFTRIITHSACPPAPNLLLANPPYVRHHHLDRDEKLRLHALVLQRTGLKISGLAGLYVYFLLLATTWMEKGGIAAWLIPSEFMDVNYGAPLREFLATQVTLRRIHRFDPAEVQFDDALVSSAIVVFENTPAPAAHHAEFSFGGPLATPAVHETISRTRLRESNKWSSFPRHATNDRPGSHHGDGPRLGDFFRIQRGIATGCNDYFILPRAEARRLGLPAAYLRPILPSPRHLPATVIEADADGYPRLPPQLCLLDCDLPEAQIAARHPELWAYLQTADSAGVKDGYLVRSRAPWYKQEQRQPAPFLCTYMGRGTKDKAPFRFIWNRSAATATNLYLLLTPQNGLAKMLAAHPDRAAWIHDWLSQITGDELRGEGRVYGGGLNKIEPKELARISAEPLLSHWPEIGFTDAEQGELFPPTELPKLSCA
ncbi:MAG: Eco57I restriction-modification methylase domain-containing protein [Verrucomicrobia bacterium]|nr:Eco57I restriction-modification methylase domain-containing protein [Verrucomicrobiota bacterium]